MNTDSIEITEFDNPRHREQVIALWREVFGYESAHNSPEHVNELPRSKIRGIKYFTHPLFLTPSLRHKCREEGEILQKLKTTHFPSLRRQPERGAGGEFGKGGQGNYYPGASSEEFLSIK